MMRAVDNAQPLVDKLPPVRGRYRENASLSAMTWFRVGGPAEVLFKPADRDDLVRFLQEKPADVPVMAMGVASNLLVRDGGVRGVVVRLGREFARVEEDSNHNLRAGAGALCINVSLTAVEAGLTGLEFMRGVPGTIGGGLRMNAGAYGGEFKDVVIDVTATDLEGTIHTAVAAELGFTYRHSTAPADWIFLEATLRATTGNMHEISARMAEINQLREESQPLRVRTGGSTFKNPAGHKAWKLIDAAGCRGLERGGAKVSEKHCNFLVNQGSATAEDIEALGEEIRRRVFDQSGVQLEWEVDRIGVALSVPLEEVKG